MSEPENILDDWSDHVTVDNDTWETLMLQHEAAAAEARSTLLAEVLAVVDELSDDAQHDRRLDSRDKEAILHLLKGLRARLAALNNQTEKQDG